MNEPPRERIVAEVSASWPGSKVVIAQAFENVIEVNRQRGYELEDWRFSQSGDQMTGPFVETIIAVFKLSADQQTKQKPMIK